MREDAAVTAVLAAIILLPTGSAALFSQEPSFQIGSPRVGDQARYRVDDPLGAGPAEIEQPLFTSFRVHEPTTRLDAYDRSRRVWSVEMLQAEINRTNGSMDPSFEISSTPRTAWLPGLGAAPIGFESLGGLGLAWGHSTGLGGSTNYSSVLDRSVFYDTNTSDVAGPSCLLFPAFANKTFQAGDPLPLEDTCLQPVVKAARADNATFRAHVTDVREPEEGSATLQV